MKSFTLARRRTAVLTAAGAAIAVAATGGVALASGGGPDHSPQPVTRRLAAVPAADDNAVQQLVTSVTPCTVVDTRHGGGHIKAGHSRSFYVAGTAGFTGQGGHSGGCGIPASATAVIARVTSTQATGSGGLGIGTYGSASTPTVMYYSKATTLTAATFALNTAGARHVTVRVGAHATQVIVTVVGYYSRQLRAYVNSDGSLAGGTRVSGSHKVATGQYEVDFDRNVSHCAYQATGFFTGTTVGVEPRSGEADGVFVYFTNSAGTMTDSYFYLTVTC